MPSEFRFAAALYGDATPPVGLYALRDAVRSLRETGRFVDDEGEATNALQDLLDRLTEEGAPADANANVVARLRSLRVLLGIDSPETRGWAPAVQQAARRAIDAAIAALRREGAGEQGK